MLLIRILALSIAIAGRCLHAADETTVAKPAQLFVTVDENVKLEVIDWGWFRSAFGSFGWSW